MKRSIAAVSLGGGLQEKLYAISAAGFTLVELTESDLLLSDLRPTEIRQLMDGIGLSVSAFHAMANVEAAPETDFRRFLEQVQKKFDLMGELGASLLLVTASASPEAAADEALAARHLHELADKAQAYGIRIGYEASSSARHVRRVSDAWAIVRRADHPGVGIVLDSCEILAGGSNDAAIGEIAGDRIFLVQLADAPAIDIVTVGRHLRSFPGQGMLDIPGFVSAVLATGYRGVLSLEVLNNEIRAAPVRQTALDAMRSLTYVEEQMYPAGSTLEGAVFAGGPPPPLPAEESIGFIEFAVDADSGAELGAWLEALGFSRAGQHRSKEVDLFRQGDVLIMLNAGSDTFAHYYQHLHGTSVCAIGLHMSNPEDIIARADLYRYKHYKERRGPTEYDMPAVRSPDGSLIHFLGGDYTTAQDFALREGASDSSIGIRAVDHVARAVPSGQMGAWVLFYRTVLGLVVERSLDIQDPHGIVRSTAFRDRGNYMRLPLSCSDGSSTVVARALSRFAGAGINQIAFATDDIFSSVAAVRASGLRLLKIPVNYYRKLEEDRDVPRDLVRRLTDANILYDRDDVGGQFFHAYTDFFDGRFFFEIVQRSGGYDRYGEINASIRLAAQAKHALHRAGTGPEKAAR